ncbi:MAG: hypothetical protein EA397_09625 [Deltaproteobacteria bacterium]|nr:MAG: hypothetical protein EA397_09625 [Deltaproteobacteria bacterium]
MLLAGGLLPGCYRATVQVQPASALIELPDGRYAGATFEVRTRPWPLPPPTFSARSPGYWDLTVPVRWRLGAALGRSRTVEVRMVPEHELPASEGEER